MKKLIIVILLMLFFVIMVSAELSDETLEMVDNLWWEHYGDQIADNVLIFDPFDHWGWTMSFDDGKLIIETQDGKWFIEMEKVEE